jgi:gliding motility-associated lipoprotein GldD
LKPTNDLPIKIDLLFSIRLNKFFMSRFSLFLSFNGIIALLLLAIACQSEEYTPKSKAYPRVNLPAQHGYRPYNPSECPFSFEYSTYAEIIKDTAALGKKAPSHPCWMSLKYPTLNATIYLSYKPISQENTLPKLVEDAHTLNSKHVIKADYIEDSLITTPNGISGLWYDVGGNAASNTQFFVADSVKHFLWASLYFYNTPNEDSIAPVANFIRQDMKHLLETFKWK